jgi:hypothetical protein
MSNYVVVKLVSGEQLMASLHSENESTLNLINPMLIRIRDIPDGETITAVPFCQFSSEKHFEILKAHVVYKKQMHEVFVPHYNRIVKEHDEEIELKSRKQKQDVERYVESLTTEDIQKQIEALESILGDESKEEEDIEKIVSRGNKTFH